jgi:NhaP-type Na+/H+ or K+/H+ antiporter
LSIVIVTGLGVGARWFAWRLKLVAIVLFAAAGLVTGPGLDLLHPRQAFAEFPGPLSVCASQLHRYFAT